MDSGRVPENLEDQEARRMLEGKRIAVVLPAYNAAMTLEKTYREIPLDVVDEVILVDDASRDETVARAREIGIPHVIRHPSNRGYGGNQKTCYLAALEVGADVVIMVHPDYQYSPRLITALAAMVASGIYDAALGSRILGAGARKGGMPLWKYIANRGLTCFQNLLLGYKLSEYHTGYRAFSRRVLETLPLEENSDDFVFDNQMLVQLIHFGFSIAEISCPTLYAPESSSISLRRSIRYGFGVVAATMRFRIQRAGLRSFGFLDARGRRLEPGRAESVRAALGKEAGGRRLEAGGREEKAKATGGEAEERTGSLSIPARR
jgi:glycosyltransferase involved in cell wall biosynthesis